MAPEVLEHLDGLVRDRAYLRAGIADMIAPAHAAEHLRDRMSVA